MEKIKCPICNNNKFEPVLISQDNLYHIKGKFNLVKCQKCSLLLTNPRPNQKEIKKFYPQNYAPYQLNIKKTNLIANLKINLPIFYKIIDPKDTIDINTKRKKINALEIGYGAGNFLYELKIIHSTWNIFGTDFKPQNISKLKKNGINVFSSNLTKISIKSNSIDIVYGWMILEHIHNINQALLEIHRILKKNGKFYFSVPNTNSWGYKLFKKNWFALQLPTHLYHFTPASLSKLLNKNKIKIKKIIYQRSLANFFFSLQITISNCNLPSTLKQILLYSFQWNSIIYFLTLPLATILAIFHQSGRITVLAKKYE